jgi:hypothetical protein
MTVDFKLRAVDFEFLLQLVKNGCHCGLAIKKLQDPSSNFIQHHGFGSFLKKNHRFVINDAEADILPGPKPLMSHLGVSPSGDHEKPTMQVGSPLPPGMVQSAATASKVSE